MTKVLFHYPHLKFWAGGTRFLLEVATQLSKKNEVLLLTNVVDKKIVDKYQNKRFQIISFGEYCTNDLLYWILFPYFIVKDLIDTYNYAKDLRLGIAFLFPSNLILALLSRINKNFSYYYYCYEPFPFFQNLKFINTLPIQKRVPLIFFRFLYRNLDTWATKQAKKIFTLNEVTAKMIRSTYDMPSVVTLMGVDTQHFQPQKKHYFNEKYKGMNLISHSTDYTTMKNTDLAIKTFAHVVKKAKNCLLLISSTRPDASEKKNYQLLAEELNISEKVIFLDLIDYQLLPQFYSDATCYISCSYDEMLGTTSSNLPVKESLACQTPAVRANITTEDVEDGVSGYLVDPRNIELVAKKILFLISHPEIAKKMGIAGRKKILRLYSWENVAEIIGDTINLYD